MDKPILLRCPDPEIIYAVWGLFIKPVSEEDAEIFQYFGMEIVDADVPFQQWVQRNTVKIDILHLTAESTQNIWAYMTGPSGLGH